MSFCYKMQRMSNYVHCTCIRTKTSHSYRHGNTRRTKSHLILTGGNHSIGSNAFCRDECYMVVLFYFLLVIKLVQKIKNFQRSLSSQARKLYQDFYIALSFFRLRTEFMSGLVRHKLFSVRLIMYTIYIQFIQFDSTVYFPYFNL